MDELRRRGVDDDRAVHLRQLVQQLRGERVVEPDAAREEERELGRLADDDQRALVRADDVVDPLRRSVPGAIRATAASSSGLRRGSSSIGARVNPSAPVV